VLKICIIRGKLHFEGKKIIYSPISNLISFFFKRRAKRLEKKMPIFKSADEKNYLRYSGKINVQRTRLRLIV